MASDLLPPNATPLERAMAAIGGSIASVPLPIGALMDPATIPSSALPWLAFALSIDRWDANWSDEEKRAAVASAIPDQRIKGSRLAVERVLARYDALAQLVEWWQAGGSGDPHTFEVRLPLVDAAGAGPRLSAATLSRMAAEIARTKPARSVGVITGEMSLEGLPAPLAAATVTGLRRIDLATNDGAAGIPWAALLQDEHGAPLADDFGTMIDGSA